tara:strand:+ start:9126 stop:9518 length:393 start_codon:yes stop_codon:yes gene_type:complete
MVADLFHVGHLNIIKEASSAGDVVIVGVHSDKDVAQYKRTPVINQKERCEMVKACRYVDEVIEGAPLVITEDFLTTNKIDLVIHGDDVTEKIKKQHQFVTRKNMMKYIPYTKGVSTTSIINKIIKEYGER